MTKEIYPLTIIADRYSGCYSGGEYTAWNLDFYNVPKEIDYDDVACNKFWLDNKTPVGKGNTPQEAIKDLEELLNDKKHK